MRTQQKRSNKRNEETPHRHSGFKLRIMDTSTIRSVQPESCIFPLLSTFQRVYQSHSQVDIRQIALHELNHIG